MAIAISFDQLLAARLGEERENLAYERSFGVFNARAKRP
jgi:hypothetical protein